MPLMLWMAVRLLRRCGSLAQVLCAALLLGTGLAGAQAPTAPTGPVPVADFFRNPAMSRPLLSPSGQHVAVHLSGPDGRIKLAVLRVEGMPQLRDWYVLHLSRRPPGPAARQFVDFVRTEGPAIMQGLFGPDFGAEA